jgi:hypothetical protein
MRRTATRPDVARAMHTHAVIVFMIYGVVVLGIICVIAVVKGVVEDVNQHQSHHQFTLRDRQTNEVRMSTMIVGMPGGYTMASSSGRTEVWQLQVPGGKMLEIITSNTVWEIHCTKHFCHH